MARTVLEYVQALLSAMESDNVDTLSDTTEATDAANLLKDVYYELLAREDWPFLHRPIELVAVANVATPTSFTVPDNIKLVEELSYNVSETGSYQRRELRWVEPRDFLRQVQAGEAASNRQLVELGSSVKVWVGNDTWPSVYTSFDDQTVVMDSFKATFESTLTTARLQGYGVALPSFTVEDTFVPLVASNMEPLLQAELNRKGFRYYKQITSESDEQTAQRQLARSRKEASKLTRASDSFYRNSFGKGRNCTPRTVGR